MTKSMEINSDAYWDARFAEDWETLEGPAQSRFFATVAIGHLPNWLLAEMKTQKLALVDWGCAQGDGTCVWAEHIDAHQIIGVDFSPVAIEQAIQRYPNIRFINDDWLLETSNPPDQFDIVFSSNTLEHFREPYRVLNKLCDHAEKAIVLALPYREQERHAEHLFSFFPENIPIVLPNGFRLCWSRVVDCSVLPDTLWPEEQIILIFADPAWTDRLELTLSDVNISPDTVSLEYVGELLERRKEAEAQREIALAEREAAVVQRDEAVAQQDVLLAQIELIRNSRSWRMTRPLRILARVIRYGVVQEDYRRLVNAARRRYHTLPLPPSIKRLISRVYHGVFRNSVRWLRTKKFGYGTFKAPSLELAQQLPGMPDYIVWGVVDWHFRHQRPQQLAMALASTGRRVFYVSSVLIDDQRAGFDGESVDESGRLFQVQLYVKGVQSIYLEAPTSEKVAHLRRSIGEVLEWARCQQIICLVDHPFWYEVASVLPNSRLVYDCMDHHEGFGNNAASLIELEKQLLSEAELTITTSTWLNETVAPHTRNHVLIRNAGEFEHFANAPQRIFRDPHGRRVIGYYGAIAEWFDLDLVEAVARGNPDCSVLLIGADTVNAKSKLCHVHNVSFTGEVPYGDLPYYLHGFDICLLPFKVIPLTLATNPVKIYEYLAAGKPVVSVDLPEMTQFGDLVHIAGDKQAFVSAVDHVLSYPEPHALVERRKEFAAGQTWQHRVEVLIRHAESPACDAKVSVIVVTYNNIDLTRKCLESLEVHSQYNALEVIVVDNASSDGTPGFLSKWVTDRPNRRLILNEENRGFAAANNQGLAIARGDYLVLLNNDTFVTPGWVRTLVRHLQRDNSIGMIGPVTNNIGNEAKIEISYSGMDEMLLKAATYTRLHVGQTYPLRTAAFFCVMMPRSTYERVGDLDEAFGRGFFEDDDYCRRVEQLGLRVVCARDVFIHHHLSASFNKLKNEERRKLFDENRKLYEAKWGQWTPHSYK